LNRWAIIRETAARVLAEYEQKANRPTFTSEDGSHTLLKDIARRCFGLPVNPDPDLSERRIGQLHDFLGITYWPGLSDQRRDFTIAHEIGHKALKHPAREEAEPAEDIDHLFVVSDLREQEGIGITYDSRDRFELEANIFAAELLAPIDQVRQMTAEDPNWSLEGLSAYFGLSKEAMANQLVAALLPGPGNPIEPEPDVIHPLDNEQLQAKEAEGNVLVVAGPGAGKTRVLTERFLHLVEKGVPPQNILALTFANKAAEEMRTRVAKRLPGRENEVQVSTFHSLGLHLLTRYADRIGLSLPIRLLSEADAFVLLRSRHARLKMGRFEDLNDPTRSLRLLLQAVKQAKNELIGPEEYTNQIEQWRKQPLSSTEDEERIEMFAEVAEFYRQYQEWLRSGDFVDYGDLLIETVHLLENPGIAEEIRGMYHHLLVDEFQDINAASGRIVELLDGSRKITWAVGDPRQCIYRFQGSSIRNLSMFSTRFPGSRILTLRNNYRSVAEIVIASDGVRFPGAEEYREIFPIELQSVRGRNPVPAALVFAHVPTSTEEMNWITEQIRIRQAEGRGLDEVAILCRKREHAQAISVHLEAQGLPTNWAGILHQSPVFKDLIAILGLAADDSRALVRLAKMEEHTLIESDLRILATTAASRKSLAAALYLVQQGEVEGLSEAGEHRAAELLSLFHATFRRSTPWSVLAAYLFELSRWPRKYLHDDSPDALRVRTTIGQVADLVRQARHRTAVIGGQGIGDFLRYLALRIESGIPESASDPPRIPNAVNIVTMHGSKGLQWPTVFLPHLIEEKWKPQDTKLPLPRFLTQQDDLLECEEADEACLLYVAMTRAKNELLLSAPKQAYAWNKDVAVHPLIAEVHKRAQGAGILTIIDIPLPPPVAMRDQPHSISHTPFTLPSPIPHHWLETYGICGFKFLYERVYNLRGEEEPHRDFVRIMRRLLANLAEAAADESLPDVREIRALFMEAWKRWEGEDTEDSLYVSRGMELLSGFYQRLQTGECLIFGHEEIVLLNAREISVRIDELPIDSDKPVIGRYYFSQPLRQHREEKYPICLYMARPDRQNLFQPLYHLYPFIGRQELVAPPQEKRVYGYKKQLTEAIQAIEAGYFSAAPSSYKCRTCPFKLCCPAS
jgi:DNA helicase II / ATP-dependent DNA helicase PcrA